MTKTNTSDAEAALEQISRRVDAGCELVPVVVTRESLWAIDAAAHCIRLNPSNFGAQLHDLEREDPWDAGRRE